MAARLLNVNKPNGFLYRFTFFSSTHKQLLFMKCDGKGVLTVIKLFSKLSDFMTGKTVRFVP